jgi:DNA-binding GntR family transcriptional regulator
MMTVASDSYVDRAYDQLRRMAIGFELKPGERLNEGELARQFGVSRTPLREALNRLTTEGFLRFSPGKGFFCRELDPKEIYDLYQLRKAIEVGSIKLALHSVPEAEIAALEQFLTETGPESGGRSVEELAALDETFHERLMAFSGNREMLQILRNVNAKIKFVRWIDMDPVSRRPVTQAEHRLILERLKARDEAGCVAALEQHIDRRQDQITAAIREGIAQIYMPRRKAG